MGSRAVSRASADHFPGGVSTMSFQPWSDCRLAASSVARPASGSSRSPSRRSTGIGRRILQAFSARETMPLLEQRQDVLVFLDVPAVLVVIARDCDGPNLRISLLPQAGATHRPLLRLLTRSAQVRQLHAGGLDHVVEPR